MPLKKQVPKLSVLSIDSMCRNIVAHGKRFSGCRENGDIYVLYKKFQYLFTNDLLRKFIENYIMGDRRGGKEFGEFTKSVFEGKELNPEAWPCLAFFFNEHTTTALPFMSDVSNYRRMSNDVSFLIMSRCKNIRSLASGFCSLAGVKVFEFIPSFQHLQSVSLQNIYDSEGLSRMLQECPSLTKLSIVSYECTDAFLFALCKHCSTRKKFIFCPENGACSDAGKRLQLLHIGLTPTTGGGIACALQHLPLLQRFVTLPSSTPFTHLYPDVLKGIMILRRASDAHGRPCLNLQLTDLAFNKYLTVNELQDIFTSCPKLTTVQLELSAINPEIFTVNSFPQVKVLHLWDSTSFQALGLSLNRGRRSADANQILNSMDFNRFINTQGKGIQTLSFLSCSIHSDDQYVNNILKACCNLKELNFLSVQLFDTVSYNIKEVLPPCIMNLETLCFRVRREIPHSYRKLFVQLLSEAKNLKYLNISCPGSEQEIARAVEVNDWRSLEELCISCVDVTVIPLEKLVVAENNLRKITFRKCRNALPSVERYNAISKQINLDLEIETVL